MVTIGYRLISVTAKKMNTKTLVRELEACGIRLSVANGKLKYAADAPIPRGIVTTLTVEEPDIIRHLESLAAQPDATEATSKTFNPVAPPAETKPQGIGLLPRPDTLPRLPFALERLVSAASSNLLTGFTFEGVPDINRYVLAWAGAYLVGDQVEARARLEQVQVVREASS